MAPAIGTDGRFKPKQPKPRKKKTAEQKSAIAKRNKAESARTDEVALQRKRQQALLNDPRKFLTEGMSAGAQREVLKQYDRVFVALDKDATDKAITIVRTLHSHVPTRLMVLHTDLKNMEKDERNDFLRSHINR